MTPPSDCRTARIASRSMHHPWRRLREMTHVELLWHDGGAAGLTRFAGPSISLRRGMSQAERRSTICHELEHLDAGPGVRGHERCEERAVEREAAKRLIGLHELGEALAWSRSMEEAAEELWVDAGTLRARLDCLHPAERAYLRRRLAAPDAARED